jgi:hypothetical protein
VKPLGNSTVERVAVPVDVKGFGRAGRAAAARVWPWPHIPNLPYP